MAEISPELITRDEKGNPQTVRYEAVNAMLLNEFLKEHRKGQEQDATIAELKSDLAEQQKEIAVLSKSLKEQGLLVERMNARLAVGKSTPYLVAGDQ